MSLLSLRGLDLRARLSKFFATQIDEVVWQWLPNGIWKFDTLQTTWNAPFLNGSGLGPVVVYPLKPPQAQMYTNKTRQECGLNIFFFFLKKRSITIKYLQALSVQEYHDQNQNCN